MAKNNEVAARVRITIGGVEASKKNLEALQTSSEQLSTSLNKLKKQEVKLIQENDVKGAAEVVKEQRKIEAALKSTKEMIRLQEAELNNYTNILDNLAQQPLTNLQKGLRDLQNQMKQTLTMNDIKRYGELRQAYNEVLQAVDQLSGKVPNLTYVLKNVGQVANKTLSESVSYLEKLIASTDKTTKEGRANIKKWTTELKTLRKETESRAIKVLEKPEEYAVEQIRQAVNDLKSLQSSLKLNKTGIKTWDEYVQKIKQAETYLDSYNQKQKETEAATRRAQTEKVLANPLASDVTTAQLQEAIKHGKELQAQLEHMGPEWEDYAKKIKVAEERLDEYNKTQKQAAEDAKALAEQQKAIDAINAKDTIRTATGTYNITTDEAKARVESIKQYMGGLNMSTQIDEIQRAKEALEVYEAALGKVKEELVDVSAVLKDPKNFSIEQLQKAIKQLEETGLKINVDDAGAIRKNIEDIERLRTILADTQHSDSFVEKVVKDAEEGKASVVELEKAIAMTKEKLRHTKDANMAEKLKENLDVLNPALEMTKVHLGRVENTLKDIKGSSLGSLREAAEKLNAEISDVNFNMDNFASKAEELRKVKARIKELEDQTKSTASALGNAYSRLKNWVLIYAGSQEIWDAVKRTFQGSLQLSDAMADVRKVTGLTADEVARLTDEVQKLDTRITNEQLMSAATEAGRIGLKTRKEVLEFTKASAITLTALDELDARSITSVMKLNSLLGETARLGVQQAILSTASSINELSMASSAAQQPIIDFSRRFGGIAAQANISTSQVLALGATIDALGQPIEMSSTALNKFTTALLSNGKQIAEDTGLSEEYVFQMTRQGKTIELMIEVLGKLNNMGGIGEIQKYMGDMGGEGARMTAVISALAANLGFLRQNLDLSNQSFEEGISVINEYNLKNENAAALVARMGNEIKEAFTNSVTVKVITFFVSLLQKVVHFMLSGSVAAVAMNKVLILVIARFATLNKSVQAANTAMLKHIAAVKAGERGFFSFLPSLSAVTAGFKALGKAIWGVFASNPLGWIAVAGSLIWDLVSHLLSAKDTTEKTKEAVDRANEAFEEESYKLQKLRESLDAAKKSGDGFSAIVSTLNRDYGKQIGYVLDLAASYKEVAGAIDLATAAKRKQILQEEKDKNFQSVQEDYREETNSLINSLKNTIGIGSVKGSFEDFSTALQKELYAAIASDLNKSAATEGVAKLGSEVEKVLRLQAKAAAQTFFRKEYKMTEEQLATVDTSKKEQELYDNYMSRLDKIDEISELGDVYIKKVTKLSELDAEVDRQLVAQQAVVNNLQQKQIDLIAEENDLANKAVKDYTAEDEHTLKSIVSLYESMYKGLLQAGDKDKLAEVEKHLKFFKARQRDVMLAFVENPLRGIQMKVGEDGKLYKEVLENGKYQYRAVQEMSDATLKELVDAYKRTDATFEELLSDKNRLTDSKVREQASQLSKVKEAIKKELAKNGIDIDDKGELKLRSTEYRDGTERAEDKEAKEAYKALLDNMEEYYGKRKEIILARLLAEGKTIKEKNLEIKKWEVEYRQGLVDMQSELLGKGESFDENVFIRDVENYKKAAALIQNASKTFQDKVANDMQKNRNKILDLQFLPATRGGGDAEKGIRKAYSAILKNIEEFYAKQKQLVEADYLNSAVTLEEKNRRLEDLELQHWQTRISMQREVLGEGDFFNENLFVRDLENFVFVKEHMLDESHHYQDTVRADMENTIYEQEKLLSKHKQQVEEILLGNNYQAQVDKEMQEAFEKAGLFWGEMQDRTAENATAITAELREAAKDAYSVDAEGYKDRLLENSLFGESVKSMSKEQYAAFLVLLQQFHDKAIEADKKFADQREKLTKQMWKAGGYDNAYYNAEQSIKDRQEKISTYKDFEAISERKAYKEQYKLTLEQWALEEWRLQTEYELAVKEGETEEQLLARRLERAEIEKEMQRQITEAYLEEYDRRLDKANEHAEEFGKFAGTMASAAWNSVDDRKKAGEELLSYIAKETADYIRELIVRNIKEKVLRKQGLVELKEGEKEKQTVEQEGADASLKITEIGGKMKTAVEEQIAGNVTSIAEQTAVQGATTAVQKANVDAAAGAASGAAKTIGELGWWGIPLIAAIQGILSMLLSMATGALSSTFGKSTDTSSKSTKRLATGMLTYAEGRYPVMGNDGRSYNAKYESQLQTKVYDGGREKAHMAIFSEVMPEMVVSGPTTKIIQEDYPALMNAIMMIDKYGALPQPKRMRTYASGNLDGFESEMVQNPDGTYIESPAITELRQSNAELRDTVAHLAAILENGIHANINMYGTGGIKESMDKANKFYTKNRIK